MIRTILIGTSLLLLIACGDTSMSIETKDDSISDFVLGTTHKIQSKILNEERIVNVYFPKGQSIDPLKKYPVIYLLDGSKDEDFIHIVGLAQFANFPWTKMLEPTIIVGIANVDRKRDFTYPSNNAKDNEELPTSGGSSNFMDFIEKELQPYIDNNFPTNSNRSIIGQSLGGLLATEILLKRPHLFSSYMIISPSLWWDDKSLLDNDFDLKLTQRKSIYLAVGKEGEVMEGVAKTLSSKLKDRLNDNLNFKFDYMEDVDHGKILHMAVYRAFENFFGC